MTSASNGDGSSDDGEERDVRDGVNESAMKMTCAATTIMIEIYGWFEPKWQRKCTYSSFEMVCRISYFLKK